MGDEPVRQREFDRYREAADRELARLRREQDEHELRHASEAAAIQHRREWTWQRVLGVITAAGVLVGLELQYVSHH